MKMAASRNRVGLVLLIIAFTRASAQTGFLRLDCGASGPHVDKNGVSWVPDDTYMSSGATAASLDSLATFRYFPDATRTRYCYSLPTTIGQSYFIRASHCFHSNPGVIKFDVALDVYSTKATVASNASTFEYFFRAYKGSTQYCLFRLPASGDPFISSLELHPGSDLSTLFALVAGGSALLSRIRFSFSNTRIHWSDDEVHAKTWFLRDVTASVNIVNSTTVVDTDFAVMKTASSGGYTAYYGSPMFHENPFIINVYLAELDALLGPSRAFDILINDEAVSPNAVGIYSVHAGLTFAKRIEWVCDGSTRWQVQLNVTLAPTSRSGSLEFLSVHEKLPGTVAADVDAIEDVKKAFGLGAMWTGDPCVPKPYDWLLCSADSSPRITAVNLSSANLSGQIPDMRALTSLTALYLDNNQLTGPVPDWLTSLPNLKELHLQHNAFTGSVPKALHNLTRKFAYGPSRPALRVEGNPGLCEDVPCPLNEKKSNLGTKVGVVVGVLVVVTVVVMLCCRRRHPARRRCRDPHKF